MDGRSDDLKWNLKFKNEEFEIKDLALYISDSQIVLRGAPRNFYNIPAEMVSNQRTHRF